MTNSLGVALPAEMARVRDTVMPCLAIGPAGGFALTLIRASLDEAARALASGDCVAMIAAYNDLKKWHI